MEAPALKTEENAERQPWHKPEIQRLVVKLDTGLGGGSVVDADGFEFSTPSDRRLKQGIVGLEHALEGLLSLNGRVPSAHTIALLAEAIKGQQGMIEDLQAQVADIRQRAAA